MGKLNQKAEQRRMRKEARRAKGNGRPGGIPGGTPNGKGGFQITPGVDYYPAKKDQKPTPTTSPTTLTAMAKPVAQQKPQQQKLVFAAGDDWAGLAKFYVGLNPHIPFPEIEKKGGICDFFLKFIPGETIRVGIKPATLSGGEVEVRFLEGYKTRGEKPEGWIPLSKSPGWFQAAWTERKSICEHLEGDLTPWAEGLATALIKGEVKEKKILRIYFQILRHRMPNGKVVQAQFGIEMSIDPGKEVIYTQVFDPQNQFGVKEGDTFPLSWFLQKREDPVLHSIFTWAKMEVQCITAQENLSFSRPDRQPTHSV